MTFQTAAFSQAGAGIEALAFGRHTLRIAANQTGGALGVFEAEVPAGEGPPFHVHEQEEELIRVLSGQFTFWCEGAEVTLGAGGVIVIPRGAVHRFMNTGAGLGTLFVVVTPGGFEGFFPAVASEPLASMERIGAIAEAHHLRFVMDAA